MNERRAALLAQLDQARAAILNGDPDWQVGPIVNDSARKVAQTLTEEVGLTGELAEKVEGVVAFAFGVGFGVGFESALDPSLRVTMA